MNNSDDVREAALQEVSVDENPEGEAGATVTVDEFAYEPRTCSHEAKHPEKPRDANVDKWIFAATCRLRLEL